MGPDGDSVGMHGFGASAPAKALLRALRLHRRERGASEARRSWSDAGAADPKLRGEHGNRGTGQRAPRGAHRGGHERLARPDPAQPDRVRASSQRLVDEDSLRGVTSNPAIFEKAILGSEDYDEDIERLAGEGLDANEIYLDLAIKDVQMACDVMRPVWEEAGGADGFVSLEVEPALALDTDATLRRPASCGSAVDRPNVMIKIPGTDEGAAGDRGRDRRRHQRERDAAVLGRVLRGRGRALHQGAGAPPRGRRVARRALRGQLLRLARGLRGGQAPREARPRGPAGQGRDRQRARRLHELQAHLPRRPLREAARGRRAGAAPAVGLDRGEEPQLLRDEVRRRAWWRPTR